MQNSNPTVDNLIQWIGNINNQQKRQENDWNNDNQSLTNITQQVRVQTIKYKLYSLWIILLISVFYWSLETSYNQYNNLQNQILQADQSISQNISKSQNYDKDITLIKQITDNNEAIINCINSDLWCTNLSKEIIDNINIIKSYLQLNTLENSKMKVDEKKILKNINEFLAQDNPFDNSRKYNWEISEIKVWEVKNITENLNSFEMILWMQFENKNDLLKFLWNIENNIYYQNNSNTPLENSILYKIRSMDYDIVNYDEQQEITLNLEWFYYLK